jgi:XRE family aerobic/anaerobic benzoate catabolism transcriptional regulator
MTTPAPPAYSRDADAYLQGLGERVRKLRNQRGMSRKVLAQHAKVSERYLAQLETGKGNGSIVLLRRISRALGLPVTQLVNEGAEPALDLVLLTQFLERLPPTALSDARELLLRHFSEPSDDLRNRRIALIGLRGGGKSTLGRLLAAQLNVPFIELDRELRQHRAFVMATSGSIVTEPGTLELLLASCFTVWVRAAPDEHMKRVMEQGDMRPMAGSARAMEDLVAILRSREPLYAKAAAELVTSGKTPDQNLAELLRVIPDSISRIGRKSTALSEKQIRGSRRVPARAE